MLFSKHKQEISKLGQIDCIIGNSIGEYSALSISNFLSFESAFQLILKRGELMEKFFEDKKCVFKSCNVVRPN